MTYLTLFCLLTTNFLFSCSFFSFSFFSVLGKLSNGRGVFAKGGFYFVHSHIHTHTRTHTHTHTHTDTHTQTHTHCTKVGIVGKC